jgi:hypothetical protein
VGSTKGVNIPQNAAGVPGDFDGVAQNAVACIIYVK